MQLPTTLTVFFQSLLMLYLFPKIPKQRKLRMQVMQEAFLFIYFFRNGTTEYPFIAEDNSYDFNYQESKSLTEEIIFRQGESMQMICDYDSSNRKNFTIVSFFSFSTKLLLNL